MDLLMLENGIHTGHAPGGDRLPPQSRESERSLLGCAMRYPHKLADIRRQLGVSDFYFDAHQKIFRAITGLDDRGHAFDLVGVTDELRARGHLDDVGGDVYVVEVYAGGGIGADADVQRIVSASRRRDAIHTATSLLRDLYDSVGPIEGLLSEGLELFGRIADRSGGKSINPLIADAIPSAAFNATTFDHSWIIENVMVAGEPLVIGGPSKTMKTGIIVDAAVSIASGTSFLGEFRVDEKQPVYVISAESGAASLQARMRQVCKAKGVDPADLQIVWYTKVETLSTAEGCRNLEAALKHWGAKVAILDPSYLLLGGEVTSDSAGNLFAMGKLLSAVGTACLNAGATPIVVAHSNAQVQVGKPMELAGIAWSGFQQWMRQWWLLSRREAYEDSGVHRLMLRYGGSAGHTGLVNVDVDEGTFDRHGGGKKWEVKVEHSVDAKKAQREAKAAEELHQIQEDCGAVLRAMILILSNGNTVATRNAIQEAAAMPRRRVEKAIAKLVGDGSVIQAAGDVRCGSKTKPGVGIRRQGPSPERATDN